MVSQIRDDTLSWWWCYHPYCYECNISVIVVVVNIINNNNTENQQLYSIQLQNISCPFQIYVHIYQDWFPYWNQIRFREGSLNNIIPDKNHSNLAKSLITAIIIPSTPKISWPITKKSSKPYELRDMFRWRFTENSPFCGSPSCSSPASTGRTRPTHHA